MRVGAKPYRSDMTIEITHRRMSPPNSFDHDHITDLKWRELGTASTGQNTRQEIVDWLDNQGGRAVVSPGPNQSEVGTVDPGNGRAKFLRTYADGQWNNNLLSLPTF